MWMTDDGWIGVLATILFVPGVVFGYGDGGELMHLHTEDSAPFPRGSCTIICFINQVSRL